MAAKTIASLAIKIGVDLSDFESSMKEFQKTWGKLGNQMKTVGTQIGVGFTAAGGAVAAGLGLAVNKAMEFDAEMSRVGAIAGATGDDLAALRQAALDLGASTSKSATEVAQGMETMAAKGYDAQQVIAAMPGVIAASEASGEDMALVADTVSSALNAFGLSADQAIKVADVLATSANSSAAGIVDLQYAFKYAAPVANSLGVSMEQLAAATGIMADRGMKGEQAGTTLRAALLRLADPTDEAKNQLTALGVSVTDASGKFLPFDQIIGQLQTSTANMSNAQKAAALSTIFGTEAMTGMLSLVETGPAKFNELTAGLQNSGGASADAAAKMKDNLAGSMEQLTGAVETLQISLGSALAPAIRWVADAVAGLVGWFNNLSPETQKMIAIGAALVAGLLVLIGVLGFVVAAVGTLITAATAVSLPMLGIIAVVAAVVVAIAALAYIIYQNWDSIVAFTVGTWETIKSALQAAWDWIVGLFTAVWAIIGPLIMAGWEAISSVFTAYYETLIAIVTALWETIKTVFSTVFLAIYYLVTGQWDKIGEVFSAAAEKLKGIVSKLWDTISGAWSKAFDALLNAAKVGWEYIQNAFSSAWDGISSFFAQLPGQMMQFGRDMIMGMVNGVRSAASALLDAAKDVVMGAVNAAKSFLGIHSPSKVFMEIGSYTGEGFAIGLADTSSVVGVAAADMTVPAINSMPTLSAGSAAAGSAQQPMTLIVELDGKTIARSTLNYMGGTFRVKGAVT